MIERVRDVLAVEEWPDARVVDVEGGREVRMAYRTGCHNYALGVALAFFMAATLLGHLILWRAALPDTLSETAIPFFLVFSGAGGVVLAVSYLAPVWFYEIMEGER